MKEFTINGTVMKCYPLTAAQRLHYYTIKYCPFHQVLCIGTGIYVKQDVNFDVLKESIYEAYSRMDSMRLRFLQDTDETVYQYVVPFEERDIPLVDFSNDDEEHAHDVMRKWTAEPFKRYNTPMNKVVMIKLPNGYNGMYLKVDHMTMDSSSIIAFSRDVLEIYCSKMYDFPMPKEMQSYLKAVEKDLQYEDNSPAKQKDAEFWKSENESENEPMYTDFTGMGRLLTQRRESGNPNLRSAVITSTTLDASIAVYHLEEDASKKLMKFCEENRVPMANLLIMGLRTVLSKFNDDEKDVSIKSCVARRGTILEKRSGGTRIHFFPLRTIVEPEMTFLEALHVIQLSQNKLLKHANYDPIEYTMKRSQYRKFTPGASYESVNFTYQPLTMKQTTPDMPDIDYKSYWYTNGVAASPFYLTVMHRPEDNGLNFNFEYKKDTVTEHEIEFFYYYLCRVLFRGIEDPNRTVGEILEMI